MKHENHTPNRLLQGARWVDHDRPAATDQAGDSRVRHRHPGNHGQSRALSGIAAGLRVVVIAPKGNSREKNAATRAFGAELHEIGRDFDEARLEARRSAAEEGPFLVPPHHREIVRGVATCGLELPTAVPDLDTVYVPIGRGSGICGTIAARDAPGLKTKIVRASAS